MIHRLLSLIGYRGLVILGFLPLLYLTGTSLWDAVSQAGQSDDMAVPAWVAEEKAKADALASKAAGDHPPVVWLERRLSVPYRDDSLADPPNQTAATQECQRLVANWESFAHSRKLTTQFIDTFETLVEPDRVPTEFDEEWCQRPRDKAMEFERVLGEITKSMASLAALKQELAPGGNVANEATRSIVRLIDSLTSAQEDQQIRLKTMQHNLTTLDTAEKAFEAEDYEKCMKDLAQWQGPLPEIVNELRQSADFENRATKLIAAAGKAWIGGPNRVSWPPLADQAGQLVQIDYPRLPARANSGRYEQVKRVRASLQAGLAIAELGKPQSLSTWLREAATIEAEYPSNTNKKFFSAQLVAWMRGSVKPKPVPESDLQVAYMTDGTLREGVFLPQGTSGFKYWATREAYESDAQKSQYQLLPTIRFKDAPAPPPTIAAVSTFNIEMAKLEGEETNEERWKSFRAKCQSLEEELIAFRKKGGTVDVSFAGEIQFAGEILKHWSELEPFLE